MRSLFIALVAAAALVAGCGKKNDDSKAAPATKGQTADVSAGTVGADGVRRISIEAGKDGYVPARIEGKPDEKLILVFTRTVDGACLEQVKVAGGPPVTLPKGQPVEVAVTVPASGEVKFACGMDMVTGVIVAKGA